MIRIGKTYVEEGLGERKFSCNLEVCRGACCTLKGGRGAPLHESELEEVEKAYPLVRDLLPREHIESIERNGLFEGPRGHRTTVCHDDAACVFVYYDGGIARCSFERRFLDGALTWRKPISCHLFPLRVDTLGMEFLRYESIGECESGRELGTASGTPLAEFLQEALVRRFGPSWFESFTKQTVLPNPEPAD